MNTKYREKGQGITYPNGYKNMTNKEKEETCNGCGGKGLGGWFVPNTLWGLDITEICNIHDYEYSRIRKIKYKKRADKRFLENMYAVIDNESTWALKGMRKARARKYYMAVSMFGSRYLNNV